VLSQTDYFTLYKDLLFITAKRIVITVYKPKYIIYVYMFMRNIVRTISAAKHIRIPIPKVTNFNILLSCL
jgi:hypothetical protein